MALIPKGNRVLITGAANGFGKALAMKFAEEKWRILIADINPIEAEKTTQELIALGGEAHYVICDITQQNDIDKMYDAAMTLWQGIDVLVNNAGIYSGGVISDVDEPSWLKVIDTNLIGTLRCCHKFVPMLQEQKSGRIVNIASLSGVLPMPGSMHYGATKAAVVNISQSLRHELRPYKVGVTVAVPNVFPTGIFKNGDVPNKAIKQSLETAMHFSPVTAGDVATSVYDAVMNDQFLVYTDKDGEVGEYLNTLDETLQRSFQTMTYVADSLQKKSRKKIKRRKGHERASH